jgi:fluoride exporter
MTYLIVFLGAGFGGMVRHGVNLAFMRWGWVTFPAATLVINVTGSILMGLAIEFFAFKSHLPLEWRLFLTTGVLGGYTTFSTFSLDAAVLSGRGELAAAAFYVLASVVLSLAGLFGAMALVRTLMRV